MNTGNLIRTFSYSSTSAAKDAGIIERTGANAQLSVIVPCFNSEKYISETCNSIAVNAEHIALEVILVDDGSTDRSIELATRIFRKAGLPTTVVRIPNSGLSAARNVGLEFASAPHVAFLDSDDLMGPRGYSSMVRLAVEYECDQVFARTSTFDDSRYNDFEFFDSYAWNVVLSGLPYRVFDPLEEPIVFLSEPKTCTRIWCASFLRRNVLSFPEGRIFEDIGVHIRSLAKSSRVGIVDTQGLAYRVGREGALTLDRSRRRFDVISNVREMLASEEIQALPPEVGALVVISVLRISVWCMESVDLRLQPEFRRSLAEALKLIPDPWVSALYKMDRREARRVIALRNYGQGLGFKLRTAALRTKLRITRRSEAGLPQWRGLGDAVAGTSSCPVSRYHFHEARSYGPGYLGAAADGHFAILTDSDQVNVYAMADNRPKSIFHAVSPNGTRSVQERSNVRHYSTSQELLEAVRREGIELSLVDLGPKLNRGWLGKLKGVEIDWLAGTFDRLDFNNGKDMLAAVRGSVRRGYFLRSADGHRYSHAKSSSGPAVSVVVPVYNVLGYLDEAVKSLSKQQLADREIILVDDGATDGSGTRCDELAAEDPTIRVIHKKNGGCASARAEGLLQARGEYVTFIDSDDWVSTDMLSSLYNLALESNSEVVEGGWCSAYPDGSSHDSTEFERSQTFIVRGGWRCRPAANALVGQPTIWRRLYRRGYLSSRNITFDARLRRFDDMPFQFDTLRDIGNMPYVAETMVHYRQQRPGQDIGLTDDRLFVHFPIMHLMRESSFSSGNSHVYNQFVKAQVNTHEWALSKVDEKYRGFYRRMAALDLYGPQQLGGSFGSLIRILDAFPQKWRMALGLFATYHFRSRDKELPMFGDVR